MADKYILRVTAGPSYDPTTHHLVHVNTTTPTRITSPLCTAAITVRIQNYHGLPPNSPTTSPYFSHPTHLHDQYSISFALTPHTPIPGPSLLFGNDFDHPIRDRIPPGFSTAFRIVKWAIDPGLEGDVYADKPWLYGNALSSVNVLRVGEKGVGLGEGEGDGVVEEGGDGEGVEWREERGVPEGAEARKKWFLGRGRTGEWVWEEGRVYRGDFFNPYLDFNGGWLWVFYSAISDMFALLTKNSMTEFALKLPGFNLSILPYLGGEDSLRYDPPITHPILHSA